MPLFELDLAACRGRQQRLLNEMRARQIDLAIVTQLEHVQWLAGARLNWYFQPAAALTADGHLTLVAPVKWKGDAAADEVLTYAANWHSTLRNDQRQASTEVLSRVIAGKVSPRRVGVEFSSFGRHWSFAEGVELVDIEPTLYRLRRRKDTDELALLQHAIAATNVMYQRARELVRPGALELDVFNELQSVAVRELGEPLTRTGNDYQCASRGGPPRNQRPAQAGELYILDLGPAFRGYFADNCRTFAVTKPTDEQLVAWEHVVQALRYVEQTAQPGKNARELFQEVQTRLDEAPVGSFNHHLGHGIGLFPHEAPHLNPFWDDTLEVGDVFTAEPGLYAPELNAGLRLENDYLVTETGVQRLNDFPLEM